VFRWTGRLCAFTAGNIVKIQVAMAHFFGFYETIGISVF